jgi:predicted DNA-binding protein
VQTLTLKLSPELSDWLEKRARTLNRSKSEIVRQALLAQRDEKNTENALARAGDLVGKYASGKKDSAHKRHLKNFGACRPI